MACNKLSHPALRTLVGGSKHSSFLLLFLPSFISRHKQISSCSLKSPIVYLQGSLQSAVRWHLSLEEINMSS